MFSKVEWNGLNFAHVEQNGCPTRRPHRQNPRKKPQETIR
jgi:hypothetical protein